MSGVRCPACGEMDYSAWGDRPCLCSSGPVAPQPTAEDYCAGEGHLYHGDEADCEDGRLHNGKPCECGRCYCGFKRYQRGGGPVVEPCPAGGEHTWGRVEQHGSGRTATACVECGTKPGDES